MSTPIGAATRKVAGKRSGEPLTANAAAFKRKKKKPMTVSARKLSFTSVASLFALLGICAVSAGCTAASDGDNVGARLTVLGTAESALSAASISSIDGTYGGACGGHAGDGSDTWSLSAGASTLAVAKNDTDCVLTIANIVAGGNTYAGTPAIGLSTADTWKLSPSAFASSGQASFYANAKISALTFAADFGITLLVSDSQTAAASDKATTFETVNGTVSSLTVLAPNYTIDMTSMNIQKDANAVVLSTGGYAQLVEGATPITGQDYAVYLGSLASAATILQMTTAFAGAAAQGSLASLTSLRVPSSSFSLNGLDLHTSTVRTVIVRNMVGNVPSYQLFTITFTP